VTKRNLAPVLLVMILLMLLAAQSVPSAASSSIPQNEVRVIRLDHDSGKTARSGSEPASSASQPNTVRISGGGSLHLIR
jgi:hypothetical protein